MSDYDFPPDLIEAQRAFWEADAQVHALADSLPPSLEMSPEQHAELDQLRAARMDALKALNNHSWWGGTGQRHAREMALKKKAKA
ncbi:hypothetical protein ABT340_35745 [Streptosporangium sp. NPDC000239]|uniref:hypothetical protein n=1 Tax=Streptosporangium sp. NPDC000239 TaxID=3154248 RepID=UPI00332FFCA5